MGMADLLLSDDAVAFRDRALADLIRLTIEKAREIARSRNEGRVTREHMEEAVQVVLRTLMEQLLEAAGRRRPNAGSLVESWLADASDYDRRVWPTLAHSIQENRLSDRNRFRD